MPPYLLALLFGIIAGLRTMTAPAAISWAAHLGWLGLQGTALAFLGAAVTPTVFIVLAIGELVIDLWPKMPSRTGPFQFGARLVSGALCGAAIGLTGDVLVYGIVAGLAGAVIGTLGGAKARSWLASATGHDLAAGLIEDFVAVVGAAFLIGQIA